MADVKSYASRLLLGYDNAVGQLASRYATVIKSIDYERDINKKRIKEEKQLKKNEASAMNKVALHNTKSTLLDRGLSKSGESVQANIDGNIALNNAFAGIERDAQNELAENEKLREKAKSSALADFMDKFASLESEKNKMYMSQLNADRDYEAEREDEKYRRFAETREYEAEREDEKYRRFADNRDYEAQREDERYDRLADNRDYEAKRDDERYDRYADNRDYEAERNDEKFDRYANIRDYEMDYIKDILDRESEDGTVSTGSSGITPVMKPKEMVDKIYNSNMYGKNPDEKRVRKLVSELINDKTVSYEYRYEVMLYAKARGLY